MFIFTKISLTIMSIIMITIIAEIAGKLDTKYGSYIISVGLVIQFIVVIIQLWTILRRIKYLRNGVKIIRYRFEDKYIKGDADILPQFITTTNPRKPSIFNIYIEVKYFKDLPYFGIYKMGRCDPPKMADMKKHVLYINAGTVNDLFIFIADIIVRPDEKINFKFRDDANIKTFFIGELYIP